MTPMIRAILLLAATIGFALTPALTPPVAGYDPALFPVQIARPAIQPAGYAFAIWGVIYVWLITHAVFGVWPKRDVPEWDAPRLWLIAAALLGALWLVVSPDYPRSATAVIWAMLAAALGAFLRTPTLPDRWMLSAPIAMLAGWVSAAAAVALGVVLARDGYLPDVVSAVVMLALVLAIAVTVQMRKPAMPVYGLTVIWALAGVIWANRSDNLIVAVIAGSGIAIMVLTILALRKRA
ncbi:MAG: hypothetical protein V4516_15945 [Pseudomonadota bacterium]